VVQNAAVAASSLPDTFVVAKHPDAVSSLPSLVRLPLDGGLLPELAEAWTYRFLATALADLGAAASTEVMGPS
jgi:hypothetical protein